MENKSKLNTILLVIIIILLVVVLVYIFLNNSKKERENNLLQENQNSIVDIPAQNVPVNNIVSNTETNCLPTTVPWIKVISPAGGEVYTAGQQVKVKWTSCNIPTDRKVLIVLDGFDSMNSPYRWYPLASDGSYNWTVPDMSDFHFSSFILGFNAGGVLAKSGAFTINTPKVLTTLPQYIGAAYDSWPPIIETLSTIAYSCTVGSKGGDTPIVIEQRVIGTKKYCISKVGDGYAGGYGYTYNYTTANGNGIKTTKFTLLYQSCGVWKGDGTTKYADCQASQSNFNSNLDVLIDSLMW